MTLLIKYEKSIFQIDIDNSQTIDFQEFIKIMA